MPRKQGVLTYLQVKAIKEQGTWAVGGCDGLAVQINGGNRSWVLRYNIGAHHRTMGLGSTDMVDLAEARQAGHEARKLIRLGIDPIDHRKSEKKKLIKLQAEAKAKAMTFKQACEQYLEANKNTWRNEKHGEQWKSTLETYAYPIVEKLPVGEVDKEHVLKVLKPIWHSKTETAARLRGRIETVLDYAAAHGYREGLNPARWTGHLEHALPSPSKIAPVRHMPYVPVADMPGFFARLRAMDGIAARALELVTLTASRSGEVYLATWDEIDLGHRVWSLPGERTKTGDNKRIPLVPAAVALLKELPRAVGTNYCFPAPRGGPLSNMALNSVMRRMEVASNIPGVLAVPHGLRSSFSTWRREHTDFSEELAEVALGHRTGNKVAQAYQRGDLFEKRKQLMQAWADFISPVASRIAAE